MIFDFFENCSTRRFISSLSVSFYHEVKFTKGAFPPDYLSWEITWHLAGVLEDWRVKDRQPMDERFLPALQTWQSA